MTFHGQCKNPPTQLYFNMAWLSHNECFQLMMKYGVKEFLLSFVEVKFGNDCYVMPFKSLSLSLFLTQFSLWLLALRRNLLIIDSHVCEYYQ